jgi:hypothetical protein
MCVWGSVGVPLCAIKPRKQSRKTTRGYNINVFFPEFTYYCQHVPTIDEQACRIQSNLLWTGRKRLNRAQPWLLGGFLGYKASIGAIKSIVISGRCLLLKNALFYKLHFTWLVVSHIFTWFADLIRRVATQGVSIFTRSFLAAPPGFLSLSPDCHDYSFVINGCYSLASVFHISYIWVLVACLQLSVLIH